MRLDPHIAVARRGNAEARIIGDDVTSAQQLGLYPLTFGILHVLMAALMGMAALAIAAIAVTRTGLILGLGLILALRTGGIHAGGGLSPRLRAQLMRGG